MAQALVDQARANLIPGLVEHGKARVFLAYEDDQPVGLAICLVGLSSVPGRTLVNIHDIAVAPQVRGRRVERQLLAAILSATLVKWAAAR
jgi:GNAT superfamily N-acetyltransferase